MKRLFEFSFILYPSLSIYYDEPKGPEVSNFLDFFLKNYIFDPVGLF